ncbi:MAG: glycosyltransferase [Anaerolineales bacterium]|nr:glycosyltransferase [Anaerolineales bacterium]
MTRVAILGAGIAGLSSGWLLKQNNLDFIILEKQPYIGGLARSFEWHGFNCDFAAHRLFTTDEVILQKLLSLVPMGRHIRRSQIYLYGNWMSDPLDTIELVSRLPVRDKFGIIWDYLTRPKHLEETNFENFVLKRYGKSLYRIFFQPYTEKLFGITGDEISVLWARQKVRLASPMDHFKENSKTKFQYFYYPIRGGYGTISQKLYHDIEEHVKLEALVTELEIDQNKISAIRYVQDGVEYHEPVDFVISSLPLSLTCRMLGHNLQLGFQKVDAVYLLINRPLVSDNHWFYFTDSDVCVNRLVEFKNMSSVDTPEDRSVICAEVTQHHQDVAQKVVEDLTRIGLVKKDEVLDTLVVRENFAYPVYNQEYDVVLKEAQDIIRRYENLYLVGRNAEFRHREVDDNFAAAIEVTNSIVKASQREPIDVKAMIEPSPTNPLVYVVILTFNHYEVTQECLASVTQMNYSPFEIVLVDNGSSDDTVQNVLNEFPSVHVIENGQNLGVPTGYNVGFQYALNQGADFIYMLNNDTVVSPESLQGLLDASKEHPNAGILMPKVLYYGSNDRVWSSGGVHRKFPPAILMTRRGNIPVDLTQTIEYAPSCGLLIHRQAFEKAGLFDPGYFFLYDDWDFSERVRAHGMDILYVPTAHIWHKVATTTKGPQSPLFWRTYGASTTRFFRRYGKRSGWFWSFTHIGYIILREFVAKGNWKFWPEFRKGMVEGMQKPLSAIPMINDQV